MELPAVNLKAIIFMHWLLTTWGCLAFSFPTSYAWSNFTVLALGVWAVAQRDSIDAIIMFLGGLAITLFLDIIHISIFYPRDAAQLTDTMRFSTGMAIFSLLLKPLSCLFVYHMYRERGGELVLNIGFLGPAQDHGAYQPIDPQDSSSSSPPSHPYADLESKAPLRSY
ncbi:type-1 angiotensin II receptor-associated protein [Tachyglossus aculeatus]|uniref:type-1 angiotensin II receptor-associated protein n=1 Tax=Tachyglossus aculeatus TaxID=9261 RepID=UPI0018F367FB|nr:type-1 angiotensin II receptor-associated protein [Tachyglossus aculeatus]